LQHAHSEQEEFFILPHRNRHKQRDAGDGNDEGPHCSSTRTAVTPDGYNICCLNPRHIHQPNFILVFLLEIDGQFSNAQSKKRSFTVRQEQVGNPVEVDDPLSVYMMDHLMLLDRSGLLMYACDHLS
jgi:hypothetical protein